MPYCDPVPAPILCIPNDLLLETGLPTSAAAQVRQQIPHLETRRRLHLHLQRPPGSPRTFSRYCRRKRLRVRRLSNRRSTTTSRVRSSVRCAKLVKEHLLRKYLPILCWVLCTPLNPDLCTYSILGLPMRRARADQVPSRLRTRRTRETSRLPRLRSATAGRLTAARILTRLPPAELLSPGPVHRRRLMIRSVQVHPAEVPVADTVPPLHSARAAEELTAPRRMHPISRPGGSTVNKVVTLDRDRKISRTTRDSKAAGKVTAAEERELAGAQMLRSLISLATLMAAVAEADREDRLEHSMPRKPVPAKTSTAPRRPPMVGQRSRLRRDCTNPTLHRRVRPLMVVGTVNRRRRPVSPVNPRPLTSKRSACHRKASRPLQGTNPTT